MEKIIKKLEEQITFLQQEVSQMNGELYYQQKEIKNLKKEKRGNIFQCNQDIDLILKNIIAKNDYLMIKGSNATGLNIICKSMIKGI